MKSMRSCKHATELMSQQYDRRLKKSERFWLSAHLMMCHHCRRCHQQFSLLEQSCQARREQMQQSPTGKQDE
jgi:predicted anti-sigma-YlaC factor YlaD